MDTRDDSSWTRSSNSNDLARISLPDCFSRRPDQRADVGPGHTRGAGFGPGTSGTGALIGISGDAVGGLRATLRSPLRRRRRRPPRVPIGRQCPRSTRSAWLGRGDDNGIDGRPHSGPQNAGPRRDARPARGPRVSRRTPDQSVRCWRRVGPEPLQRFHQDDRRYDQAIGPGSKRHDERRGLPVAAPTASHRPSRGRASASLCRPIGADSPNRRLGSRKPRPVTARQPRPATRWGTRQCGPQSSWRRTSAATACCRSSDAGSPRSLTSRYNESGGRPACVAYV